jgi:hypothetical protein
MPIGAMDHKLLPLATLATLRFGQVTTATGLPLTAGVDASVSDGREGPFADSCTAAICGQFDYALARAGQRGVAGVAAGCWVAGGGAAGAAAGRAAAGAAAGRTRGSQRPFTMRIPRELHLRTAARTAEFRTQMPSTS